ncbi:MAG: LCP family protein [Candidatus Promineifilaceae bacterium]
MSNNRRRSVLPLWFSLILVVALTVTGVTVSLFAYLSAEAYLNRPINPLAEAAEQVAEVDLTPLPQVGTVVLPTPLPGEPTPTLIPTSAAAAEESDRINVLVLGIDRRPGEPFISRTDSMMIVSVDLEDKTASILSIPRDLYVVIPGHGRDRINTAMVYGGRDGGDAAAGALLAMRTVEYNLGVPLDHYFLVDFGAVIRGIDAIGGLDIYVPYEIYDPSYPDMGYGFDPLYIPAGQVHMDGELALKYARTRHQDNDFFRARRQQQVMLAIRDKLAGMGPVVLLRQAPGLYERVNEGIFTDLSLADMLDLARIGNDIESDDIRSEVLDQEYVTSYRTDAGASVLVPINETIGPLIQELFYE